MKILPSKTIFFFSSLYVNIYTIMKRGQRGIILCAFLTLPLVFTWCFIFIQGLKSLDKDFTIQTRKQNHLVEEQQRCYSHKAIPLHYEPLKKSAPPFDDNHTPLHDLEHLKVSETTSSRTWHRLSKVLLLRKAAITFFSLAKSCFAAQNLPYSFKYIKLSLQCFGKIFIEQTWW